MLTLNHKKLEVWKKSIELVKILYKITERFPNKEIYGIVSQIRRAAISVPSNIAEGSSRSSSLERKRFYEIARSSLVEVDTQIEISKELNFLGIEEKNSIESISIEIFSMLSSLINNLK